MLRSSITFATLLERVSTSGASEATSSCVVFFERTRCASNFHQCTQIHVDWCLAIRGHSRSADEEFVVPRGQQLRGKNAGVVGHQVLLGGPSANW